MSLRLQREMDKLKQRILTLGAIVEKSLRQAINSIDRRDVEMASAVIENDRVIDRMEVELEEECQKILALHQPVAGDLRMIVAILKINNDLERVGDLSTSIAKCSINLTERESMPFPFDFETMESKVRHMLKLALDSLTNVRADWAQEVCQADDEIDDIYRGMFKRAAEAMKDKPENIDAMISMMGVARRLERIADLVTNIAEDVIYMIDGRIIRHGFSENP